MDEVNDVARQVREAGAEECRAQSNTVEPLWAVADVARYLGASESWVYHQSEARELPCVKFGRLLRFEPDAIRAYVCAGRVAVSPILAGGAF